MSQTLSVNCTALTFTALRNVPLVRSGDDLAAIILDACEESKETLCDGDILLLAQKIVSKAEGMTVNLADVIPTETAIRLAKESNKDPRLVEVILGESNEVIRHREGAIIVENHHGMVLANAGIDASNVEQEGGETVLLLPNDPDLSCAQLRNEIKKRSGKEVGVVINDSLGRAFRNGTAGAALGVAGVPALVDLSGETDLFNRPLRVTQVAIADELAAAASLLMGQASEGRPIILLKGFVCDAQNGTAKDLVRHRKHDLFRDIKQ